MLRWIVTSAQGVDAGFKDRWHAKLSQLPVGENLEASEVQAKASLAHAYVKEGLWSSAFSETLSALGWPWQGFPSLPFWGPLFCFFLLFFTIFGPNSGPLFWYQKWSPPIHFLLTFN